VAIETGNFIVCDVDIEALRSSDLTVLKLEEVAYSLLIRNVVALSYWPEVTNFTI
jgi:hypothetical protein